MSSRANDFQFELNETLYFNRGDEVLELVGISLNPEITIHENNTDVFMRGEIELHGEYMRDEQLREDDEEIDDFEAKRYVNEVVRKEDNLSTFTHRFPVDITVPASRVENINDITIEIVNFDYEMPMNSKFQFTALAEIQGIKAEVEREERESVENEMEKEETNTFTSFDFEVKREENQYDEEEQGEDQASQEFDEREESEEVEELEDTPKESELTIRAMEGEEEESEEESEDEVKDVSYLTDIFREEVEESHTKMRICIVQEEDTIESIAERFEVSALQLIKQNKLDEDFDINEGQLLYIPKK